MKRFAAIALLASACVTTPPPAPAPPPPKPFLGQHGYELSHLDRSISPCDDFYQYATGGWRRLNPLPSTYSRYGRFEEVADRNRETLRAILEQAAKDSSSDKGSNPQKIGDFWTSCVDEQAIEAQGVEPIRADLDRIDAVRSREALAAELLRLHQSGLTPLFRLGAQNDYKNSGMVIAVLAQAGLGLPDRDYYLRDDEKFATTRRQYVDHLTRLFVLAGLSEERAGADAARVLALETELARASMARVDQRRPENVYHITPVSDLGAIAPAIPWTPFLQTIGLADLATINVAQPEYLREAGRLVAEAPIESLKAYLRWIVLDAAAPYLSSPFVAQDFAFRGKVLTGQGEIQPRWQRCIRSADANIGEILGQEYVKRAFTPEAKARMNELIDNLIAALREGIPTLAWMGSETKQAALAKLEAFRRRIGYPDEWIDYSALDVTRDSYAANIFAANAFRFRRSVGRIGKPDDPNEWGFFTPATVNAGYSLARNDITFPAGILQPPFYDPNADDAYNYGAIGMVIGHEMTHGFDDQGAKFDAEGNLRNWWSAKDLENFQARAECIADQYGSWVVEEKLNLQGTLVTGEAIADLGGAALALRAYRKSLEGKSRLTIDGFTPEQRFFLGFAQVWAQNMSAEEGRRRALTDPHAPGPARVNLTVSNMPEFADAWNCPVTSKMVREPEERCDIW